ncbi:MAG TPA: hypothetical protein VM736_12455 [Gemmatimonadales bacterium]|nr:hypothetical protein [Gemmatimonadales bacterium]
MKLFGVMMAIMIPAAIFVATIVLVSSFAKGARDRRAKSAAGSQELAPLADSLERIDSRLQQLEERVDFIERVLPAVREGNRLQEAPRRPE